MTKSEKEMAQNQLVENGLGSYLDALAAVREFQKEIIKRSRRALEEKLNDLSKAMGIPVDRGEIANYITPVSNKEELGEWGWGVVTFSKEPVYCYFGLRFERENSKCVTNVDVSMWTYKASQRDFLLKYCKDVSPDFDNDYGNSIGLFMPISKKEINNFEEKLEDLIDKWVEVWKKVGGIKNLSKK